MQTNTTQDSTMQVYLDNAATTKTDPRVNALMAEILENEYGNPSSLHRAGMLAEKRVKAAAQQIAAALGCAADEIYFTSGGTEADNLAILGYARANQRRGRHIVTTPIEHPAVAEPIRYLAGYGFEVDYLTMDRAGNLSLDELEERLREDTVLVSAMAVNNEVGSILPIPQMKAMMKRKSPHAALHTDAVQAFGKMELAPAKWGVDLLSISAHKIHGPKGVGALYVKKGTLIEPIVFGGHQQQGLRSGTENVAGIAGFGEAARLCRAGLAANLERTAELREALWQGICQNITEVERNGDEAALPYILNVSFAGVRSEILLHAMEHRGVYLSSGSACSSNRPQPSQTLTAMGKSAKQIDGAMRFSLSAWTTEEEIEYCIEVLKSEVKQIRRYIR